MKLLPLIKDNKIPRMGVLERIIILQNEQPVELGQVATMVSSTDLFVIVWINFLKYVNGIIPCYMGMTYPYSYPYYIP
jgi:hypothetical protein